MNKEEMVKCVVINFAADKFNEQIIKYIEDSRPNPVVVVYGLVQLLAKTMYAMQIEREMVIEGLDDCLKQLKDQKNDINN